MGIYKLLSSLAWVYRRTIFMKRKLNTISCIVSNLPGRVKVARQIFSDLCLTTPLLDLLGRDRSCAIVGGAVRDVLLMSDPWTLQMFHQWPDIDIAVVDDLSELPIVANSSSSNGAIISTNTFGGLKISHESLGSLDVWTWMKPGPNNTSPRDWRERLNMVEFGLNAVAFIWPQREIIIHPRWIEDLKNGPVVEKVYLSPVQKAIQTIRAVALATKLEGLLGTKVILGKSIIKDLKWLVENASRSEIEEGLSYLRKKIDIGRWPDRTLYRFSGFCRKYRRSFIFDEVAYVILGKYVFNVDGFAPQSYKKNRTEESLPKKLPF